MTTAALSKATLQMGYKIKPFATFVDAARQNAYHAACELPLGLYGAYADASVLANDTIHATRYLKTGAQDGLHAGQRIQQTEPVKLGEALTAYGEVVSVKAVSKGHIVITRFRFERRDGSVPLTSDIISLQVDHAAMKAKGGGGSSGRKLAGQTLLSRKDLSPERVGAYSFEFPDYKVHFEPDVAASMGLRAPIAQGLMSLSWVMGEIARGGAIAELDLSISFRQPIFWDDKVAILRDGDEFFCANGQDEICSLGQLHHVKQ